MTPKKAAKKTARKAAKKAPGKHNPQKAANDARRSFEHLGRVQAIASLTTKEHPSIQSLTTASQAALQSNHYKESADLLRAAEHLSFSALVETDPTRVSPELAEAIQDEVAHLLDRAREHGAAEDAPRSIRVIYARMAKDAASALRRGAYRAALELARGAEALTHVHGVDDKLLDAGDSPRRLKE